VAERLVRGKWVRERDDGGKRAYEIDADNQLRLGAALARDLCHVGAIERSRSMRGLGRSCWRRTAVSPIAWCLRLLLRRIARRARLGRIAHLLLLLLLLRGIARSTGRVDGREGTVGTALLMLARRELSTGRRIGIRRRAAEGVLLRVHGGGRQ
jgi:hypothetical protein